MRSDGQRNRAAILAAATALFAEKGVGAPLDEVARRAGVGNATLYRHFPTRRDLQVAVAADEATALREYAEVLAAQDSPAEALFGWLHAYVRHVAAWPALIASATDSGSARSVDGAVPIGTGPYWRWRAETVSVAAELLERAHGGGAVRTDLEACDLIALADGIALTAPAPGRMDRLLGMLRHAAVPVPVPA
ncbi:TetR/AcrR family transcriptional regulator [Jiangella asiatica]|nr:TetR/AcrR family transcriptional regulator [Jiangella asiatica]